MTDHGLKAWQTGVLQEFYCAVTSFCSIRFNQFGNGRLDKMLLYRHRTRIALLLIVLTVATGYGPCSSSQQPETVADTLITLGNIKRDLRARNEITPQQDYDISQKLLTANRAYRQFVTDELARLDTTGAPDPSARDAAIRALVDSLKALQNPAVLGLKSDRAQKAWREGISTLATVIAGLEALRKD